jgi:hypothetical protein
LAYVTGLVNQELLLQNEYLAAENRILKARLSLGWRLSDGERITLAVLTWRRLVTYYVLIFVHLESRKVSIAGITDRPEVCWMPQVDCNATLEGIGHLNGCRYVLHDRDAKFGSEFCQTLAAGGVQCLRLLPAAPTGTPLRSVGCDRLKRSAHPIWSCSGNVR